jgi:alcohol dehydrogenase
VQGCGGVGLSAVMIAAALGARVIAVDISEPALSRQIGLLPEPPRLPMDLIITRELRLLGSHGMAAHAYPEMLGLVTAGRLRPGQRVSSRIALEQAPDALVAMTDTSPVGLTVIHP